MDEIDPETQYQLELERDRAMENLTNQVEEPEPENQPIGWGIFITALSVGIIADIIEIFTVGTVGWVTGIFLDIFLVGILLISKPTRKYWKKWTWGPIIESIPFVNTIPLFRAVFLTWAFISSRSKIASKISKITHIS